MSILDTRNLGTTRDCINSGIPPRKIVIVEKDPDECKAIRKALRKKGWAATVIQGELADFLKNGFVKAFPGKFIAGGFFDFTGLLTGSAQHRENKCDPLSTLRYAGKHISGSAKIAITTSLRTCGNMKRNLQSQNKFTNHLRTINKAIKSNVIAESSRDPICYKGGMCYEEITFWNVL